MEMWKRLRRLMGVHAHDALTHAEDPVKLVNFQVAEMQEGVERAREEIARAIAAERRLQMQGLDARRAAVGWEERARWAVTHGDDDLAREALHRRQASQQVADYYHRAHEQQQQAVVELKATLRHLGHLLQQSKARRTALLAHRDAALAQQAAAKSLTRITGAESTTAFERLADEIAVDTAQASAALEMHADDPETRFQAVEAHDAVESELRALKQELGYLPHDEPAGALEQQEEAS
jgi:phage shock protein A